MMNQTERNIAYREFLRAWGEAPQLIMAIEEAAVLIVEKRVEQIKDLITYGEQQWDGQPINKGMLEGLREALRIMEGK